MSGIEVPLTAIDEFSQVFNSMDKNMAELLQLQKEQMEQQKKQEDQNENTKFSWTELRSAYSTVMEVVQAGQQVWQETFDVTVEYAGQVRDLAIITGTGAEATSRFLQVLDDYELTQEDALAATKAMKEKGLVPTIDTLASLADQYKEIDDPAQKMVFIQENLGRGGAKWVNILNQSSDSLRAQAAEINKNLILTDQQAKEMEEARLAADEWSDAVQGMKIQAGAFLGHLVAMNEELKDNVDNLRDLDEISGKTNQNYRFLTDEQEALVAQMERGAAMTELYNEQLAEQAEISEEDAEAIKELSNTNEAMLKTMTDFQGIADSYNEKQADLSKQSEELLAEKQKLVDQGYSPEGEKISEINQKLAENAAAQRDATAAAQEALKEKIASMVEAQLSQDGITTAEFDAIIALRENFGLLSADAAEGTRQVYDSVQNYLQTGDLDAFSASINTITDSFLALPEEKSVTLDLTFTSNGSAVSAEQLQFILTHLST